MTSDPPLQGSGSPRIDLEAERRDVEQMIEELEREARAEQPADEFSADLAAAGHHPADVASDLFERERELGLLEDARHQREEVDRALSKLDAGTYGYCEGCGDEIAIQRLHALPSATRCLGCQEAVERDVGMAAPSTRGLRAPLADFLAVDDADDVDDPLSAEESAVNLQEVDGR